MNKRFIVCLHPWMYLQELGMGQLAGAGCRGGGGVL